MELSNFEWGPVALALIPLALAVAVVVAEALGWVEPPASSRGCRCGRGGGL